MKAIICSLHIRIIMFIFSQTALLEKLTQTSVRLIECFIQSNLQFVTTN